MTTSRSEMDAALKRLATEVLRPKGFSGSIPHLRRISSERLDVISFQHHSAGGSFVVEVASCDAGGLTTYWGKFIEPTKVKATDVHPSRRPRLGSPTFPVGDHWFDYGPRSYEPNEGPPDLGAHCASIAAEVARLIDEQAEPFWAASTRDH